MNICKSNQVCNLCWACPPIQMYHVHYIHSKPLIITLCTNRKTNILNSVHRKAAFIAFCTSESVLLKLKDLKPTFHKIESPCDIYPSP